MRNALDRQIHGWLGYYGGDVVLTWIGALLRCHPTLVKLRCCGAKDSKLDSLRFSQSSIFFDLVETFADRAVVGIVDVDVSAWSRIGCLNLLVAVTFGILIECYRDSLFHQELALNVFTLLLIDGVLTWTWILNVSLLSIGCIDLV